MLERYMSSILQDNQSKYYHLNRSHLGKKNNRDYWSKLFQSSNKNHNIYHLSMWHNVEGIDDIVGSKYKFH